MKKNLTKTAALLLALLLVMSLAACQLTEDKPEATQAPAVDNAEDRGQIAAKVGDQQITKGELADEYDSMLSFYTTYYGMSAPTADADIESYQDAALEGLVAQKMVLYQAGVMGVTPLSADKQAEIDASYQEEIDGLMETFRGYAVEEGAADTDARALELIEEALSTNGWNMDYAGYQEWLKNALYEEAVSAAVEESIKSNATVSDSDVETAYSDLVTSETEAYASAPADYIDTQEGFEMYGGSSAVVVPEGFVRVKVLAIAQEAEIGEAYTTLQTKLGELEAEYGKLALTDSKDNASRMAEIVREYDTNKAEADKLYAEYTAEGRGKAETALAAYQGGAPFDTVLMQYGDDEAYETYPAIGEKGRLMLLDGEDSWAAELHTAVKALADGEVSGIIESDGSFYIVQRVGTEAAGTRALSDVRESVEAMALAEAQDLLWEEKQAEWLADKSLITYYEEIYRSVGKAVG